MPYLRHHARPIRKWLARHIQSRLRGQKPAQADLLQALIDTNAFSPQQLVDQVSVLFLAGHETSASALAMAGTYSAKTQHVNNGFARKFLSKRSHLPRQRSCAA